MTAEELAQLVRNLPQAQPLDLYRLEYVIRALYSEPKRTLATRIHLRLGMQVRFFGRHTGVFHTGRIVAMNDHGVTLDEPALNLRHRNVPYAAIDLQAPPPPEAEIVASMPPRPATETRTRAEFKVGDRVVFKDRNNIPVTGTISRINHKTVTVAPDNEDGHWRVSAALLNHLVDI
jgi:hypothetical protein